MSDEKPFITNDHYLTEIDQMERHYLIGREKELELYQEQLNADSPILRILNLYGTGGVGKSYLLDEFRRLAVKSDAIFLLLDSRGFSHTPQDFCKQVLRMLQYPEQNLEHISDQQALVELCQATLQQHMKQHRLVLAIDTFEELGDMELWFQDVFLPRLHTHALVLIASRFPLQGLWLSSPARRKWITRLPIAELDYHEVKHYLERSDITEEHVINQIWLKTKGHPLTLSLLVSTTAAQNGQSLAIEDNGDVFGHVVRIWLKEVPDEHLRDLVETVAVLRHFNQEFLSYILDRQVPTEQFHRLIGLSFIRMVDRGWILHDLMREAISQELRLRRPDHYDQLWKRSIKYYYHRVSDSSKRNKVAWESAEWFYYIGDQIVRLLFYQKSPPYYAETLNSANWAEAEQYLNNRRQNPKELRLPHEHPSTKEQYDYIITKEESLYTIQHIHLQELYELDASIVKLMRDPQGMIYGMSAIIPIHAGTLEYLLTQPLSSAYFNSLPEIRLKEFRVPRESPAGYFIRSIDVPDFSDLTMRAAAGLTFISLLFSTGFVVAAPPELPFFRDIHMSLGCETAHNVVHYDYDNQTPTHVYVFDTRGNKLQQYLDRMLASFGLLEQGEHHDENIAMLSEREKEVVQLLAIGSTNQEIAASLFIAEITVKKHLTAIFRKLGVTNRVQLVNQYLKNK